MRGGGVAGGWAERMGGSGREMVSPLVECRRRRLVYDSPRNDGFGFNDFVLYAMFFCFFLPFCFF